MDGRREGEKKERTGREKGKEGWEKGRKGERKDNMSMNLIPDLYL